MSDIEAAARAVIEAWDRPPLGAYAQTMHEAVSHLRSALAHATRGEGGPPPWHAPCVLCGHRQSAHNTDTGPCSKCGCDCAAFRPTPPPATGEECRWYTGNGEEYEILPPEEVRRRRIEAARRLRDVGPATGEAGTSEVEKARAAVVDAAKARRAFEEGLDGVSVHPGADRERHRWYVAAENASIDALLAAEARAMPEAREGGRSVP